MRGSGSWMTATAGQMNGGVLTKKGKMGFAPFILGTWHPPWKCGREKKAAGLSCCCSSGPADIFLPTELPCQSADVTGSEKGRKFSLQTDVWGAVEFIERKVGFFFLGSSVNVTWREPEAYACMKR